MVRYYRRLPYELIKIDRNLKIVINVTKWEYRTPQEQLQLSQW